VRRRRALGWLDPKTSFPPTFPVTSKNAAASLLDVDPRTLHLPSSPRSGADPLKLQRQIARFGKSTQGMPVIEVSRGSDGALMINNGVTRATRVAQLLPGTLVRVEVIDDLKAAVGRLPTIGDMVP
jgi:hypothetical protein